MTYRLQLYMREDEVTPLSTLAERLRLLIDSWRASEPRADDWCYETDDGVAPVTTTQECGAALEANAYAWRVGDTKRVSYEPTLHAGAPAEALVSVTYSCGIGKIDIDGVFAPSRLVATVDPELTAGDATLLRTWMLKAIEIVRPLFGHAGSLDIPRPLMPLTPDPTPPIGWLTYLRHDLAAGLPPKLPAPAVAYPAPDGTLLVAHPELFQQHKSEHRKAVSALREALIEAGALSAVTA
jgi:hypothetical protein